MGQRAHRGYAVLEADARASTPLAPAGLILSTDARPALCRQHYLSDLCRPHLKGLTQGLTELEGVNTFAAVKALSREEC